MPGRYYTFAAGPVRFFALDTDEGTASGWIRRRNWSDTQAFWLDGQLKKYKDARWKIVYGHHPIYSDGDHGDTPRLQEKLLPILQAHKVDAYLCGHDHDLEYFIEQGIHFVVVGGGGKDLRKVSKKRALFAVSSHGFLDLTADRDKLTLRLIADSGQELFSREVKK
jgi:acid phosphatase